MGIYRINGILRRFTKTLATIESNSKTKGENGSLIGIKWEI